MEREENEKKKYLYIHRKKNKNERKNIPRQFPLQKIIVKVQRDVQRHKMYEKILLSETVYVCSLHCIYKNYEF